MAVRLKGVVIGGNGERKGERVWKVRVQDEYDLWNNMEFPIASTDSNIILVEGLYVDFIIGIVEEGEGEKVYKAIDVRPIEPSLTPAKEGVEQEHLGSQSLSSEHTHKGYKVRVQYVPVSPEEAKIRREAVGKILARALVRKYKKEQEGSPMESS